MIDLKEMRVCIVGLGLMGGSLAMAIRDSVGSISAVDNDWYALDMAVDQELVDLVSEDIEEAAKDADIVVLATPVRTILSQIHTLIAAD